MQEELNAVMILILISTTGTIQYLNVNNMWEFSSASELSQENGIIELKIGDEVNLLVFEMLWFI